MLAPWVVEEMKTADLNDQRLNERLLMVLDQLASHPTASIPAACGGYAETVAAYRLFDNEKATFAKVLAPHIDATRRRIAGQSVVLLAQDTTEIDLTRPEQEVFGAGPLDGSSRRGAFLHLLHAFTPNGTALGTLHAQHWTREDEPPLSAEEREARKKHTPIEEKESYRWVTTLEHAQAEAARNPNTQFVCLADSEADIYELMITGMAEPRTADWIVRACQDRASQAAEDDDSRTTAHLAHNFWRLPSCSRIRLPFAVGRRKLRATSAAAVSRAWDERPRSKSVRRPSPCVLRGDSTTNFLR